MKFLFDHRLPQELVDEVISHLRHDKVSLSNCSLVNRAWSPFARKLLFRSVHITPSKMPTIPHEAYPSVEVPDWSAFARTFHALPCVASWVTELHILGTSIPREHPADEYDTDEDTERPDAEDPWQWPGDKWHYIFPGASTLHAMASALPRLRDLYIQDLVIRPSTAEPAPRATPLASLTLKNVGVMLQGNVLWELLRLFRPRERVVIDIFWRPGATDVVPAAASLPPATAFVARRWRIRAAPSIEYMLACLEASPSFVAHAESLDVALNDEFELQTLMLLLKASAATLKELKMDVREAFFVVGQDVLMKSDIGDAWDEELNLALCHKLETLQLTVLMGLTRRSADIIRDLCRALLTLPNSVRTIRLVIDFAFFGPDLFDLPWDELKVLGGFPHLQAVELVLLSEGTTIPDDEYIRNELRVFFPNKVQIISDILRLSFTEKDG